MIERNNMSGTDSTRATKLSTVSSSSAQRDSAGSSPGSLKSLVKQAISQLSAVEVWITLGRRRLRSL